MGHVDAHGRGIETSRNFNHFNNAQIMLVAGGRAPRSSAQPSHAVTAVNSKNENPLRHGMRLRPVHRADQKSCGSWGSGRLSIGRPVSSFVPSQDGPHSSAPFAGPQLDVEAALGPSRSRKQPGQEESPRHPGLLLPPDMRATHQKGPNSRSRRTVLRAIAGLPWRALPASPEPSPSGKPCQHHCVDSLGVR
jgi:hypothetical protein